MSDNKSILTKLKEKLGPIWGEILIDLILPAIASLFILKFPALTKPIESLFGETLAWILIIFGCLSLVVISTLIRHAKRSFHHKIKKTRNICCIKAADIGNYLKLLFKSHKGEIWLYNNDLLMISDHARFEELYVNIFNKSENISKVKIILGSKKWNEIFDKDTGNIKEPFNKRMGRLSENKIKSFCFRKLESIAKTESDNDCSTVLSSHFDDFNKNNWVFYTVDNALHRKEVTCMRRRMIYFLFLIGKVSKNYLIGLLLIFI